MLRPPFVLIERNGDLSFYRSLDSLACALEPVDVKNEGYQAFDSTGCPVELRIEREKVQRLPWFLGGDIWRERVSPVRAEGRAEPGQLRTSLLQALADSPGLAVDSSLPLEDLIPLAVEQFGLE